MKRLIKVISIGLMIIMLFGMSGCFLFSDGKITVGDFVVKYKEAKYQSEKETCPDGYYLLYELSKAGKKKNIILPKDINGKPYFLMFRGGALIGDGETYAKFAGKMEKIYAEYPGIYYQKQYKEVGAGIFCYGDEYLKKIIVNFKEISFGRNKLGSEPSFCYYNSYLLSIVCDENEYKGNTVNKDKRLANIQFLYNYEEAPNEGYFWTDDIDNGEKMEVMPDTPEREGYTFEGWYNEKECINKFDFNTVFNKPVLNEGDIYPEDYVTYVYAKWTQNP